MLSELLLNRATTQKLHGVISHQDNINEEGASWLERFVTWEVLICTLKGPFELRK